MTTGRHLNDAGAAEQLATVWNQMHTQEVKPWDLQAQADMAEQEEQCMIAEADEARLRADNKHQKEDKWKELEKKHLKINDFDNNKMVGDFFMPHPSQFAVGKFKSFSFIELWYFTKEGCSKAQETNRTLPEDTYSIMWVDDLVTLKPVTAFKASKNAISDANLTWRQMNIGKNMILCYMEICNWPQKHTESFARFYLHLELDLQLAYQAKVRCQWHEDIARGQGFNIAQINHTLLATITEEVWDTVHLDTMRKVNNLSLPS